jgi:hypothetical protein
MKHAHLNEELFTDDQSRRGRIGVFEKTDVLKVNPGL